MPARMRQHEKIHDHQLNLGRKITGHTDHLLNRDRLIVRVEADSRHKGRLGVYDSASDTLHITHDAQRQDNFHQRLPENTDLIIRNAKTSLEMQDAMQVRSIGEEPQHVPPRVIYNMLKELFAIANDLRKQKTIHANQLEFDPNPLETGFFDTRLQEGKQVVIKINNGKYAGYIGVYSPIREHLDITHKAPDSNGFHEVSTGPGGAFGPVIGGQEFVAPYLLGAQIITKIHASSRA